MSEWDPEAFENALLEDMRAHGGQITTGPMAGQTILAMTSKGAKTGQPRRRILTFSLDAGDYIVAGTASGSPKDPKWLANLRANPKVSVEAGGRVAAATATIETGAERDRLWQQHVAALPWFAEYPEKTGRVIPMVRLSPRAG